MDYFDMETHDTVFDAHAPFSLKEFMTRLFSEDFMPHGHCYFWRPDILWLNVISDALIALSYYAIPLILLFFVSRRKDIPFNWIFLMFGAFIIACGTTHLIDIWTIWHGTYRLDGIVKLVTAIFSVATAIALIPLVPKALALPGLVSLNKELEKRTKDLEEKNEQLSRINKIALGREDRMIELKKEVNELCSQLGKEKKYEEE